MDDGQTGPAMAVPIDEHRLISAAQMRERLPPNARAADLVIRDMYHIRTYTTATAQDLRNLVGRINQRFPAIFSALRRR